MADTLNISPDEKIAGVPLARLLRNLAETSYNEGALDLACRLTDCKAVIEELLARRASPAAAVPDGALPPLPMDERARFDALYREHIRPGVTGGALHVAWETSMGRFYRAAVEADRAQQRVTPEMFDGLRAAVGQLEEVQAAREARMARLGAVGRAQQGEPVASTDKLESELELLVSIISQGGISEKVARDEIRKWADRRAATKAAAPADAPRVEIARGRVWIVKGNQSFMLAYEPDAGDDPAEMQAYADQLCTALSSFTSDVKIAAPVPDTGIPTAEQAPEALRVGGVMSNILYNFAQKAGHTLTSDDCALFDKMRKEWGAARCASVSTTPTPGEVEKAGWISVEDARKPEERRSILVFVRTLTRGEDDDGRPYEVEGEQVEMGEYRFNNGSPYFQCFVSPMSDNDWITHWMPLPAGPPEAKTGEKSDA